MRYLPLCGKAGQKKEKEKVKRIVIEKEKRRSKQTTRKLRNWSPENF